MWRALFAFAVLRLGLSPGAVWALSLSEWIALVDASGFSDVGFGRADLRNLIQLYPDKKS